MNHPWILSPFSIVIVVSYVSLKMLIKKVVCCCWSAIVANGNPFCYNCLYEILSKITTGF